MTAPTIPASESVRQKQPAQQSNQPEQPRRKHDRLITRDMALVMLATFCFMSSNMLANPIVAGYAESLGADGMLMGAVAVDEFHLTVLPPYRRQSFRQNQQAHTCALARCSISPPDCCTISQTPPSCSSWLA